MGVHRHWPYRSVEVSRRAHGSPRYARRATGRLERSGRSHRGTPTGMFTGVA